MFSPMAQRKTLLIVDDDADLRGAVAEQLQAEDFATVEAATGGEGVEAFSDLLDARLLGGTVRHEMRRVRRDRIGPGDER